MLAVVAVTQDVPQEGLVRGHVGTIVENLRPDTYLVEFSDNRGRTWAMVGLRADQLMELHYAPVHAVASDRTAP